MSRIAVLAAVYGFFGEGDLNALNSSANLLYAPPRLGEQRVSRGRGWSCSMWDADRLS
jgi:hypothetical protein